MTDGRFLRQWEAVTKSATALASFPLEGDVPAGVTTATFDAEAAFRQHYHFVARTLAAMGVPAALADDAIQDVFMTAHRRRQAFDPARPARAWLFGIARGVGRNYRRRAKKRNRTLAGAHPHSPRGPVAALAAPSHCEPLARLETRREAQLVERFLARLSDKHRDVFVLAHLHGMTAPEISNLLEVKLNTVYSRLRVARDRFESVVCEHQAKSKQQRS